MQPTFNSLKSLSGSYDNRYTALCVVLLILYVVPALCGYPTWPGSAVTSKAIKFDNVWDTITFSADHRPIREFIASELWSGRLPLWMPHNILGLPLLEQYEYQILNPLEWITYLGGDLWWTVALSAYLFIGGLGVHAICHRMQLKSLPSTGGALAYVVAGHVPLFYSVPSWYAVVPVIPWILFCITRLLDSPRSPRHFLGLWASVSLLLLSGQPQIILCTGYFTAFFLLALLAMTSRDKRRSALAGASICGAACLVALATSAPQIIPFASFVTSSDAFTGHAFSLSGWRISAVNFLNLMFPFSMGTTPYENWTADTSIRFKPSEDFPITLYCTGSFLALVGIAATLRRSPQRTERLSYFFATLGTLATITLYGFFHWNVWPFEFVHLARYTCPVLSVFLSVMIGLGLEALTRNGRSEVLFSSLATVAGALTLAGIITVNYRPEIVKSMAMLYQVAALSLTSLFCACAIMWVAIKPNSRTAIVALIIFLADATFQVRYGFTLTADRYRYMPLAIVIAGALSYNFFKTGIVAPVISAIAIITGGWVYFAKNESVLWPAAEVPSAQITDGHRLATSVVAFSADSNMTHNTRVLGSRNPITFISLQNFLFGSGPDIPATFTRATTTIRDWRGFSDVTTGPDQEWIRWSTYCTYRKRFNAVSADLLIGNRGGTIDQLTTYPGCETGLTSIDTGNQRFNAFYDEQATPRAYFAASCRGLSAHEPTTVINAIETLSQSPFVERNDQLACEGGAPTLPLPLKFSDPSPTTVNIDVRGMQTGLVVLNDQFFKGWKVYVDNKPTEIYRVNSVMRGAIIQTGALSVRFSYEPDYQISLAMFGGSIALLILIMNFMHPDLFAKLTRPTYAKAIHKRPTL